MIIFSSLQLLDYVSYSEQKEPSNTMRVETSNISTPSSVVAEHEILNFKKFFYDEDQKRYTIRKCRNVS